MLRTMVKCLVKLLLGGEVKDSVIAIVEEVTDSNVRKSIQKVHLCACIDDKNVIF